MSEAMTPLKKPPGYRDPSIPIQMPPQPRKPKLPPSFYRPPRRRRNCCCRCCCYFFLFLVFAILLLIVCGGIFYIWFDPKPPVFHLTSLDFTKFTVSDSPDDGSSLNVQGTVGVEIKNPNGQLKMVYGRTRVELTGDDDDVNIGTASVPGFVQYARNVTELKVTIRSKELLFGNRAKNLRDRFKSKMLKVNADVKTGIGMGFAGGWNTGRIGVSVRCQGLSLKQISGGASQKCHVKLLNLVDIS